MMYTSPHSGVQNVLDTVRRMLDDAGFTTDGDTDWLAMLRTAVSDMDSDGSMATMSDVRDAQEMYEHQYNDMDIQVDPHGHALASRGDDGVWVSAWVLVRTTPT